jgi:adenine-specific DNA-methyltransferase
MKITPRKKELLNFINSYSKRHSFAPSIPEMAKRFKLAISTIHQHLEELEAGGHLKRGKYQPRGVELSQTEQMISVPLLGTIAAGEPIEAIQEKETIAIPKSKVPKGEVYALRVSGNSMIEENINDGDVVIIRNQSTAENGQKIVALIDENEATLKKYYKEKGQIRLQPANHDLQPKFVHHSRLTIQGIVLDVVKTSEEIEQKEVKKQKPTIPTDQRVLFSSNKKIKIANKYSKEADVVLFQGDRLDLMKSIPDKSIKLIVTSPPYNIGKEYEKRTSLDIYLAAQEQTFEEAVRILTDDGSICWQVGNHIAKDGEVFPLDALIYQIGKKYGLKLRNRIIWRFGHGLHCTKRFSGRHETIVWFTKGDNYTFNLDPVRVPQKYPGKKNFKKNEKYGTLSGNPLGKNPEDVWDIPNVKNNHPEKTDHPCQFPIELIERLVLSMTNPGDAVLDPYLGVGSSICAAVIHDRKGYGSDIMKEYLDTAEKRIKAATDGTLSRRMMGTPVYQPTSTVKLAELPDEFKKARESLFGARL